MYRPAGYNRIFCVAVSTELWCFEMPKPAGRQCSVLRMRANPGWGLGKIIAARKQRALTGCKREGAVCICKTINFSTKSFITNEQYEPRNAELYYFVYICVSLYLSTQILNESFVFMLFWNNDYSRGLAGDMRPATSAGQPASAQCCWQCHLSSDRLVESDCKHSSERHRSQKIYWSSEENRSKWVLFRIAIYRSSGYNPIFCPAVSAELPGVLMFWNPVPGHKVPCRACVRIPMYLVVLGIGLKDKIDSRFTLLIN